MNRLTVIQTIIDALNAKTYVEIGVQTGAIILKVKAPSKIGIDPRFMFSRKLRLAKLLQIVRFQTFEMSSDEFFEKNAEEALPGGMDVVLVDGLHTYEQSLRDVENCLRFLNPNGIIVMHDCNPLNSAMAYPTRGSIEEVKDQAELGEVPGWCGVWCGDVWKTIAHLRLTRNDLEIFTLDLDWGLGIIRKGKPRKLKSYTLGQIQRSDYSLLEKDRKNLLNLRPPKFLEEFLRASVTGDNARR